MLGYHLNIFFNSMLLCVKVITAGDSYDRRLLISQCVCVCVVKLGELPGVLLELQYRSITYTTIYEVYYSPEAQQAKALSATMDYYQQH